MIKTYSQAKSIVENKFINSPYITSRNFSGNTKYFPEEIEYWAKKIINGSWSQSLFDTQFNLVYQSNLSQNLATIRYNDHIGQTFFIDSNSFPNGLFLSSVVLFFATCDNSPVTLELRPLVNGYPSSSDTIPLSSVTKNPTSEVADFEIGTPIQQRSTTAVLINGTKFEFEFPIYLSPGYYCFVIRTNSSKHTLFVAERGMAEISTGKIVTNPYIGSMVTSQQGISWTIEQTKDLCFLLNRAKFDVGTRNFEFNTRNDNFIFDTLNLKLKTQEFGETSFIDNISAKLTDFDTLDETNINVLPNKTVDVPTTSTITVSDGVVFTISLTNKNDALSPLIDLQRSGTVLIKNTITEYSEFNSNRQLLASGGEYAARYVTKQITLNDDFDADGLTVYLDANKQMGTEIEVFYKVLNKYDFSKEFKDVSWTRMTKTSESAIAKTTTEYSEETYQDLNISYSNETGTVYNDFKYFAIKVVMYSNNSTIIPKVKNLRAIATV